MEGEGRQASVRMSDSIACSFIVLVLLDRAGVSVGGAGEATHRQRQRQREEKEKKFNTTITIT